MIKPIRATGLERLELQRLRDRVGRLYAALQEATEAEDPLASGTWAPPVDVCETEKMISIRVELPGVTAEQIKIQVGAAMKEIDNPPDDFPVNGRDLVTGIPKQIMVSYQEIADALGVSLAKVKTDIHRGREALRKRLKSHAVLR